VGKLPLGAAIVLGLVAGCGSSGPTPTSLPTPSSAPTPPDSTPSIQDVWELDPFSPLEPGTYAIDPDGDPSTPLRVVYRIPAAGWEAWIGAAKFSEAGHAGVSITTVANLVSDGCDDHSWADPPVGPSVDDLAAALASLAPFQVTTPPEDVTIYGYGGKHLAWTVPDLTGDGEGGGGGFRGCIGGQLKSWVGFIDTAEEGDAFYGYTGPGYREEFWILDVNGTRLMIAAERSPGSPSDDLAELRAILDSIRIEP
jgi:hypothetical protein